MLPAGLVPADLALDVRLLGRRGRLLLLLLLLRVMSVVVGMMMVVVGMGMK